MKATLAGVFVFGALLCAFHFATAEVKMVSEAVHKQQLAQLAAVGAGLSNATGSSNASAAFSDLGSFAANNFNTNPNRTQANATDLCSLNATERAAFEAQQQQEFANNGGADRDFSQTEYPDLSEDIARAQSVLSATQRLSPEEQAAIPIAFNWNPSDVPTYDDDHPDGVKLEEPFTDTEDGQPSFPVVKFGICSPGSYIPDWARIIQVILLGIMKIAHAIFSRICAFDVEALGFGGNLRAACLPVDLALITLEAIISNMNICNDMVTGYYNDAAIERVYHMHDIDMSVLLQQTTCWPTPADPGLGIAAACNGVDDDCDGLVDELEEDKFAPVIRLQTGCSVDAGKWFKSQAAATVCLQDRLVVQDDCRGTVTPNIAIVSNCALSTAVVSAQDAAGNPSSLTVPLQIDGTPPVLTSSIGLAVLVSSSANFQDVLLTYNAIDNCAKPLSVKVAVYSDEFDPADPIDAIFYTKASGATAVMLRNKAASSCSNAACPAGTAADGRVYHIVVSATDVAGNTVVAPTLFVQSRRSPNAPSVDGGPRWLLAEKTIVQP
jgi:hypothetical protein